MDLSGLVNLQVMMFILMGIGMLLKRRNIIDQAGKKALTDLVILVLLPCNIINAFCIEFSMEILSSALIIFIISCLIQLMCSLMSGFLYKKMPKRQRVVLQYATVCSNAGFLGNPVAEGIYGSIGLLYASIYLIPQRVVMWSAGISYFTESPDRKTVIKKVLTHPCIIAAEIGLLIMMFQIPLPAFLGKTISTIGGCTTTMSMILVGIILADANLKTMLSKVTAAYALLRLGIIPLLVFIGCLLFRIDSLVMGVSVILAAMPAGSTTAILAAKYDGDAEFASKCVVLSTLLSMAAVPAWSVVLNWIG